MLVARLLESPPPGEQDFATVSDPFTYADDNRALVVWIARRDEETRHCFEVEVENKIAPYGGFGVLAVLITPLETITLAAASRPRGRGVMESALTAIDGLPLVSRNKKKAASTLSHSQPYIEFDSASRS